MVTSSRRTVEGVETGWVVSWKGRGGIIYDELMDVILLLSTLARDEIRPQRQSRLWSASEFGE